MDNQAFRALVEERARVKTTKEIAREAVEEEFRQRRSRKRGRDSSSGEDYDSDSDDAQPSKQEEEEDQQHTSKRDMYKRGRPSNKSSEQKYRDRAKERREGKNADYESTTSLLHVTPGGDMDEATLSKYLGGDEAHTHLVKGLDVSLARKVKREMGQEGDSATRLQPVQQEQRLPSSGSQTVTPENAQDATEVLQRLASNSVSSSLGRDMLAYLQRTYLPRPAKNPMKQNSTSAAGLAIQRSTLTFAMQGHPHDHANSWQIPRENIHASSQWENATAQDEMARATTPLDGVLLKRLQLALSESSSSTQPNRHKIKTTDEKRHGTEAKDTTDRAVKPEDSDDDDDIFSDVDDDYVPPSAAPSETTQPTDTDRPEEQWSKTKGSIFAGLTSENYSRETQQRLKVAGDGQPQRVQLPSAPKQKTSVIDRDVLGTRSMDGSKQRRTAEAGVSISSYTGGYGEEMDVDFDGRFADEDDADKSKKAREETTTAALEYGGAGRGRHRDPNLDD